ncbi:YfgM family protein [Acinetobacter rathckeae]|uniref:YfgM family protein n=1 Tax=Acinetobacter rathckeae TaxID=2605272 RepID=UPI0018A32662|nr:tetratricopeptide repeat protein [Acinetobacter rathckeae]MBF7687812.1 tetratricopeptide repeat protein [Acinetobacter rathckeae]MBF7687965.1 tetratricopeptide repeat protein [Acinetobacter rathckeae]MBF7695982.1 tetratricopeptide repeat protein [Acinetobacter rathckeae]
MSALTEEEQLDKFKSLGKKYGSSVVTAILVALIAFFAWNYWQKNNQVDSQNETARVQQLMDQAQVAPLSDKTALTNLMRLSDEIVKKDPNSVQAIQAQLILAKIFADRNDYVAAEKELQKAQTVKIKDEGLMALVNLHLAYAQIANKKYDDALKTLDLVKLDSFKGTVDEARGDIYVYKNDTPNAKIAYESAWKAAVARKQQPQILQIKLESVGVLVDDPHIETPILKTQVDES